MVERRVAVVTGAGSGIGRATALRLARDGALVAAADLNLPAAKDTARGCGGAAYRVDVADTDAVAALRDAVVTDHGAPAVLVNCAGWDELRPLAQTDPAFWQKVVAINLLGTVAVTHAFLADLEGAPDARVVNVASDAGRVGSSGETVYAGAKGGVIAFTKSLAREVARHGVTANVVCPGPTDTPLFQAFPASMREALIKAIPLRRVATVDDVAHAIAFFTTPEAGYITGQVLSVSGGLTMAG